MIHYDFLRAWLTSRARTLYLDDERGSSTTETVIVVAIMAGLALAVGAIIVAKVMGKAEGIDLS